ncbi:hypothetical protein ABEB36_003886 [Hypothenemus hampei]|uniref:Uncharacterized protein n=1 Tax=Hypothenemus hampei TaxID=57062 RepID=A0ABD1F222_HYPHA
MERLIFFVSIMGTTRFIFSRFSPMYAASVSSLDLFSRAAQKLNLSSSPHRRKRYNSDETDSGGFCGALQKCPPPVPPALLRRIGVKEVTGVGKYPLQPVKNYLPFVRGRILPKRWKIKNEENEDDKGSPGSRLRMEVASQVVEDFAMEHRPAAPQERLLLIPAEAAANNWAWRCPKNADGLRQ